MGLAPSLESSYRVPFMEMSVTLHILFSARLFSYFLGDEGGGGM